MPEPHLTNTKDQVSLMYGDDLTTSEVNLDQNDETRRIIYKDN